MWSTVVSLEIKVVRNIRCMFDRGRFIKFSQRIAASSSSCFSFIVLSLLQSIILRYLKISKLNFFFNYKNSF